MIIISRNQILAVNNEQNEITIKGDSTVTPLTIQGITNGLFSKQPSFRIAASRGTIENPKVVRNKDSLGVIKFSALTNGKTDPFVNAAFIGAYVDDRAVLQGKEIVEASLVMGSCSGIANEQFVTISPNGTIIAPQFKSLDIAEKNSLVLQQGKIDIKHNSNSIPQWKGTPDSFIKGTGGGCRYDYDFPLSIDTKSTGIKIQHQGNFKQPSLRIDSYDNTDTQASWMAFTRWRGSAENPLPCKNGDFIFAFDWLGKPCESQDWEWGMAQTAIVDGDPQKGFLPVSMNWVTRDQPFGPPVCKVKIANSGKLYVYAGMEIHSDLCINTEHINPSKINFNETKYIAVKLNGEEYAVPAYAVRK